MDRKGEDAVKKSTTPLKHPKTTKVFKNNFLFFNSQKEKKNQTVHLFLLIKRGNYLLYYGYIYGEKKIPDDFTFCKKKRIKNLENESKSNEKDLKIEPKKLQIAI